MKYFKDTVHALSLILIVIGLVFIFLIIRETSTWNADTIIPLGMLFIFCLLIPGCAAILTKGGIPEGRKMITSKAASLTILLLGIAYESLGFDFETDKALIIVYIILPLIVIIFSSKKLTEKLYSDRVRSYIVNGYLTLAFLFVGFMLFALSNI